MFETLKTGPRTVIFYETPHRNIKVLGVLDEIPGDIAVAIGRELAKLHEEFLRGIPKMLLAHFAKKPPQGEMAVVMSVRVREAFGEGEDMTDADLY